MNKKNRSSSIPRQRLSNFSTILLFGMACTFPAQATEAPPASRSLSVEDLSFDVRKYRVEGNTLLTPEQIEATLGSLRGPNKTFDSLQQAVTNLTAAYFNAGYPAVSVDLPEQDITDGSVRVTVVEGKISKLKVVGNQALSQERILASLPILRTGTRPLVKELDQAVAFANLTGARKLGVNFQSGETRGDIAARVNVTEYPPSQAFLSFDNSGDSRTGDYRLGLGWQTARAFGRDHMFVGQVLTSPTELEQVKVFSLGYRLPIYSQRLLFDLTAAYSNVDAGTTNTTSGPLTFTGSGNILGVKLTRPVFLPSGAARQYSLALDWRDYDNECALGAFGAAGCGSAGVDVSLLPLTLGVSQRSQVLGHIVSGSLRLTTNIGIGPHGDEADLAAARAGAKKHYTLLRGNGSVSHDFSSEWRLRLNGAMQYSRDALVSSEQFRIAGAGSVRGYEESSVANDKGAYVNLELYTPPLASPLGLKDSALRGLVFMDAGRVWRNHIQPADLAETRQVSLASAGIGTRLAFRKSWNLDLDWGVALKDTGDQSAGDSTVNLRLNGSF